jgi:tetrahydromethanopterin S-methyltransferase subunit A
MKSIIIGHDKYLSKDIKKIIFEKIPDKKIFSSEDVLFGNPSSNVAIVFVYNWKSDKPPKDIQDLFIKLSNYSAIVGYWRTTNGGKYAFANILANPNINKILVFVFEKEDNGHLLVDSLRKLWTNGVDNEGKIIGCSSPNPKFEGISNENLKRVTKQADLVILKNIKDLNVCEKLVLAQIQEPQNAVPIDNFKDIEFYSNYSKQSLFYDCGSRFDEPAIIDFSSAVETIRYDPSKNLLAQSLLAEDLDDAVKQVAAFIFSHGDFSKDQRGIHTFEYRSFSLTVKDALSKIPTNFSKDYLDKYIKEFMEGVGEGLDDFAYTYHERIFKRWGNQVEKAVNILKKDPNTRRVLISLWDPSSDMSSNNPPCLDFIWPCIRNNKLEFHVVYRSHHLATITKDGKLIKGEGALVPNLYAIATLQQKMAKDLNIERGYLYLTDFSGHLYVAEK